MKTKYLFSAAIAALALLATACQSKEELGSDFSGLNVSSSYVAIDAAGGSSTITVTSSDSWSFVDTESEWLTVSPASGSAGETTVTFAAEASDDVNKEAFKICSGADTVYLYVQQGEDSELAYSTCADVIAGADGKMFLVRGTCTAIANTSYGNWYLQDETGEIYVYGTVDAGGNYNWASFNIAVGDIVTVKGPKKTYNGTVELVDAEFISVEKSLVKAEPMQFDIKKNDTTFVATVICSGDNLDFESDSDWLNVAGMTTSGDTTFVTIHANANTEDARTGIITLSSSNSSASSSIDITVNQASGLDSYALPFEAALTSVLNPFEAVDVVASSNVDAIWTQAGDYGAKATSKGKVEAQADLISPNIDLSEVSAATLTFDHVQKYAGNVYEELTLWASTDNGENWTQVLIPNYSTGKDWTYVSSGNISLNQFVGNLIKIKFQYKSNANAYATWEIRNVKIVEGSADVTSIGEVNTMATSSGTAWSGTFTDAVVTYVNGNNAFIEDATGGVQLYLKGHELKAGQTINGTVSGTVKLYNGYAELTALDVTSATVADGDEPEATTLTIEKLLASYLRYQNCKVKLEGVTLQTALTTDNRNTTVAQGDNTIAGYAQVKNSIEIAADTAGDLICWPTRYKTNLQVGIWESSHFTAN